MESIARKALRERDKMMRDAYYGRNGLSMTEAGKREYERVLKAAKDARKTLSRSLAAIAERIG